MRVTKKQFLNWTNCPTLASRVIDQFGGWTSFKEQAIDVANHGISGGFSGFTYYVDTVEFFEKNRELIFESARRDMEDFGIKTLLEFVKGFNCLKGHSEEEIAQTIYGGEIHDQVANGLAWYAGEEICQFYQHFLENVS